MCLDPITMTAITVAATAAQVAGQIQAGNAANDAAKANARALSLQAKQEADAANVQANDIRYAGDRQLGEIRAQQSKNMVDPSSGSAAEVGAETAQNFELDALRALYSGRIKNWQLNAEAGIKRWEGKVAQRQSRIDAVGTLLGNAAKMNFSPSGTTTKVPQTTAQSAPRPSVMYNPKY